MVVFFFREIKVGEDFIFLYKQIDEFSFFFFAIALIRKYKNNPDVSITFINEKKIIIFKKIFALLMLIFCLLISNQETQQCLRWVPNNCWSSWLIQWIDWYCDKKS